LREEAWKKEKKKRDEVKTFPQNLVDPHEKGKCRYKTCTEA